MRPYWSVWPLVKFGGGYSTKARAMHIWSIFTFSLLHQVPGARKRHSKNISLSQSTLNPLASSYGPTLKIYSQPNCFPPPPLLPPGTYAMSSPTWVIVVIFIWVLLRLSLPPPPPYNLLCPQQLESSFSEVKQLLSVLCSRPSKASSSSTCTSLTQPALPTVPATWNFYCSTNKQGILPCQGSGSWYFIHLESFFPAICWALHYLPSFSIAVISVMPYPRSSYLTYTYSLCGSHLPSQLHLPPYHLLPDILCNLLDGRPSPSRM